MTRRDKLADTAISRARHFHISLRAIFQEWVEGRVKLSPTLLERFTIPRLWVADYAEFMGGALVVSELFGRLDGYRQIAQFQEFDYEGVTDQNAFDFFRDKLPLLKEDYEQLIDNYRSQAFTIAWVDSLSMLEKAQGYLLEAIEAGDTLSEFAGKIEPLGLGLTDFHQETVFRTNIMSAYTAGQWQQIQEAQEDYIQYDGIFDDRQRDNHQAVIYGAKGQPPGRIVPVNQVQALPPFGYNCRCGFTAVPHDEVDLSLMEPFSPDEIGNLEFSGIPQSPSTWEHRKRVLNNIRVDDNLGGFERDLAISKARLALMVDEQPDSFFAGFNGAFWDGSKIELR